jgi:hypothetical protein
MAELHKGKGSAAQCHCNNRGDKTAIELFVAGVLEGLHYCRHVLDRLSPFTVSNQGDFL